MALVLSSNHEAASVSELIPDYIRESADNFVLLLEEYYRYMNSAQGPSNILSSIPEQHSLDLMEDQYIERIRAEIAPYVPNSYILDNRDLFSKIVKYFYNTRGSLESVDTFFRVFYGVNGEVVEHSYGNSAASTGNRLLASSDTRTTSGGDTRTFYDSNQYHKWKPFEYMVKSPISISEWEIPFRALIHPAGLRFFGVLLFILSEKNKWGRHPADYFNYNAINIREWFVQATGGNHSPESQPGWVSAYVRKVLLVLQNSSSDWDQTSVESLCRFVLCIRLSNFNDRLSSSKLDYLGSLKWMDESPIDSLGAVTISDMELPWAETVKTFTSSSSQGGGINIGASITRRNP